MNRKKLLLKIFEKRLSLSRKELEKIKKGNIKSFKLGHHPNWDSLQHMSILSDIESKFKIKITKKNFSIFSNFANIIKLLDKS